MLISSYRKRFGGLNDVKVEESAFIRYPIGRNKCCTVSSQAQLIVFCRFADAEREKIAEHYLFCKPLSVEATANAVFGKLDEHIEEKGCRWEKCISVTTDGTAAMARSINGVVNKIKKLNAFQFSAFFIVKLLSPKKLKNRGNGKNDTTFAELFREVVGIINYIRCHAKKHKIFSKW